jgi:O-antigen ligase
MRAWVERGVGEILLRLPRRQAIDPLFYACAFMVAASLVLGGATRSGFLSDVILALLAIPLLALGVWRLLDTDITRQMRWALWFCLALVALPLVQLVPLPGWLWILLPHRELSAGSFALIRQDVPWMPISVSPEATWLSALSLLPALSLFIGTLLLGYRDRRWLSLVILAVGVIGAVLGLVQVAQGPTSHLRFYQFTNLTEAVGFFANRNHFAALVYVLVLLASAWAVNAGAAAGSAFARKEFDTTSTLAALACFTLLVVLLAAQAMARSRAGIGLTMVALLGAFSLGVADRRAGSEPATRRLLVGAIALALVLTVQFALYRILERFDADPLQEARLTFVSNTIQAARAYMPVGSGLGSFVPVYHLFEQSQDVLANIYITRAHNDVVEAWLETGVFGLALMGWFVIWFVRSSLGIWRGGLPLQADAIDSSLARSATIIVALLAAHSFLDYPLRTSAMMAVAAFACALMIDPPISALQPRIARKSVRQPTKNTVKVSPAPVLATPSASMTAKPLTALPPSAPKERWGTDVQWPDEWGASQDRDPPKAPRGPGKPQ